MKYRKMRQTGPGRLGGDMVFGRGKNTHFVNVPEAVGQAVLTRLKLETGEWFLNIDEGMPWSTKVLGKYTGDVRDPAIRHRILETPGVSMIIEYSSNLNRETRGFDVNVLIDTIYGIQPVFIPMVTEK
jgi:hypothetical protein